MPISYDVVLHGAIADGRWVPIMKIYKYRVQSRLAQNAVNKIRTYLPTQYKYLGHNGGTPEFNPIPANAGYLVSQVHSDNSRRDYSLVTDGGVQYGPWIEGVSSMNWIIWPHRRNPPPRRFPGYFAFRKMAFILQVQAAPMAEIEIQPYIGQLNA